MPAVFDVLAMGELNPDLILSGFADDGPVIGTEQAFESQTLTLGSSTAIACVLMQRLGLRTAMAALIGDDDHGRFCAGTLRAEGVDTQGIVIDPDTATGITISLSYPQDRMLLTRYGTMARFGLRHVDPALIASARHLHVGSFFIQPSLRPDLPGLFAAAIARGQTTSLDLGWDATGGWDTATLRQVLSHVSVILPNRVELAAVTGTDDVDAGLSRLHEMGAQAIALKCGADGGIWSAADLRLSRKGFPATVVDTTGAGDAFNAGFLRRWLDGAAPKDCLALANACGALTASALGGTGGLRDLDQALAVIAAG